MLKKIVFNRTTVFVLFAMIAIVLMGSTFARPVSSDLNRMAKSLADESSSVIRNYSGTVAIKNPGAVLRANIIK